jgi:GH24 family phage-related lysozyme (muramidase)
VTARRLSEWGATFIHGKESFVDRVYLDQLGKRTIGWGHLVARGETFPARITRAEGDALFDRDIAWVEAAINRLVTYPVTQRQFDVLASLVFNLGDVKFARSDLLRKLNAGDIGGRHGRDGKDLASYSGAMREWAEFRMGEKDGRKIVVPELVKRRRDEIAVFLEEHRRRSGNTPDAPDMRDPHLSEVTFGERDDGDPPPDVA